MSIEGLDDDAVIEKLRTGNVTHEDVADIFVQTHVGQSTGLTRDEFLVILRTKLPEPEQLAVSVRELLRMYEMWVDAKARNAEGGSMFTDGALH